MPRSEFGRFLARSFEALRYEAPTAHLSTCRALAGRAVRIEVDPPAVLARFSTAGAVIGDDIRGFDLAIDTRKPTIVDLIDGRLTLLAAVRGGRLEVRGALHDVADFHDALAIYLDGAVRSPSFPKLLDQYRR